MCFGIEVRDSAGDVWVEGLEYGLVSGLFGLWRLLVGMVVMGWRCGGMQ